MLTGVSRGASVRAAVAGVLAWAIVIGAGTYAIGNNDPYVLPAMAPFFILACGRGKSPVQALALALIPALMLVLVSFVKNALTGMPLVTYDHYFLRQNVLLLAYNDWRVSGGLVLLTVGTVFYLRSLLSGRGRWSRFEVGMSGALVAATVAAVVNIGNWYPDIWNWELERATPSLRVLAQSAVIPKPQLRLISSAQAAPALQKLNFDPPPGGLPDMVFILEESTYNPALLRPGYVPPTLYGAKAAHTGPLHVHTYGGGTWLAEFSLTTQMRPHEFGNEGIYVFHQLEGRVRRSMFTQLKALGYRTVVIYPAPGGFLNARSFYNSIGVDEFYDPEDLGISMGWDWKIPDAKMYAATEAKLADSKVPTVIFMLIINQHGPHEPVDPIADYMERFVQSDTAYHDFLEAMAKRDHKTGVVAFGDHHPDFTARFLDDKQTWYYTAFDMRCVNFACANAPFAQRGKTPLDIVMLMPMALEEFGFGLDDLSLLQRAAFRDCSDNITRCSPDALTTFNSAFAQFIE